MRQIKIDRKRIIVSQEPILQIKEKSVQILSIDVINTLDLLDGLIKINPRFFDGREGRIPNTGNYRSATVIPCTDVSVRSFHLINRTKRKRETLTMKRDTRVGIRYN